MEYVDYDHHFACRWGSKTLIQNGHCTFLKESFLDPFDLTAISRNISPNIKKSFNSIIDIH